MWWSRWNDTNVWEYSSHQTIISNNTVTWTLCLIGKSSYLTSLDNKKCLLAFWSNNKWRKWRASHLKRSKIVREMWIFSLLNTVVVAVVLLRARVWTDMSVCLCEYVWGSVTMCWCESDPRPLVIYSKQWVCFPFQLVNHSFVCYLSKAQLKVYCMRHCGNMNIWLTNKQREKRAGCDYPWRYIFISSHNTLQRQRSSCFRPRICGN